MGLRPFACWDSGFESCRGRGCLSHESVMFCQIEISATGRSFIRRSRTDCNVSECDRETSTMRRPRPIRDCRAMREENSCDYRPSLFA